MASIRTILAGLALAAMDPALSAEPFPVKPVRVIVTSAPGGSLDLTARAVARGMGDRLGRPFVMENMAGAGGLIAIRAAKAAAPDGYTLLATVNTIVIQQVLRNDPGYSVTADFTGVGPMTRAPFVLVTATTQATRDVADLIARAKARPGQVTYASAGNGSTTHLAAALFAQRAGLDLQHVPYKGNAAAWPDLVAGRIDLLMEGVGGTLSMTRDGRLKALGITSGTRTDALADVPTIAEQGVPGYDFYFWIGLVAPAGTPSDVLQTLSGAMQSALADTELRNRLRGEGAEVMSMSPDAFTRFLAGEVAAVTKLAADLRLPKE